MRKMSQEICHTHPHNDLLVNNKENRAHKTRVLRNIQLAKAVPTSDTQHDGTQIKQGHKHNGHLEVMAYLEQSYVNNQTH